MINILMESFVDCPNCEGIEDDQYTCSVCYSEGGDGEINVFEWLAENVDTNLEELHDFDIEIFTQIDDIEVDGVNVIEWFKENKDKFKL